MLRIQKLDHLANQLSVPRSRLLDIADSHHQWCREFVLRDPARPGKERVVLNVAGPLRLLLDRVHRRILLPRLIPMPYSFGCIRGRSIKDNALAHRSSVFACTLDIADFYPTITNKRVYRLFSHSFCCSPDVARILTKLCTYRYRLALGLMTSPILADQVLSTVDKRIAGACQKCGITYTRFVDDVTLSAGFNITSGSFLSLIRRILAAHGFKTNEKSEDGRLSDDIAVTKLRLRQGRVDVRRCYIDELDRQLDDVVNLAAGRDFNGPYFTEAQIRGRVQFVSWINPGRERGLMARCRAVDWKRVQQEAAKRGLVSERKQLVPLKNGTSPV